MNREFDIFRKRVYKEHAVKYLNFNIFSIDCTQVSLYKKKDKDVLKLYDLKYAM